jgi:hypothetical protein
MDAPNIHNFDPKWVKKRLGPLEKPLRMAYVCFESIKIKPFFLMSPEGSAKLRLAGRGQGTSYFRASVVQWKEKTHDADGQSTSSIVFTFYLFLGIE